MCRRMLRAALPASHAYFRLFLTICTANYFISALGLLPAWAGVQVRHREDDALWDQALLLRHVHGPIHSVIQSAVVCRGTAGWAAALHQGMSPCASLPPPPMPHAPPPSPRVPTRVERPAAATAPASGSAAAASAPARRRGARRSTPPKFRRRWCPVLVKHRGSHRAFPGFDRERSGEEGGGYRTKAGASLHATYFSSSCTWPFSAFQGRLAHQKWRRLKHIASLCALTPRATAHTRRSE